MIVSGPTRCGGIRLLILTVSIVFSHLLELIHYYEITDISELNLPKNADISFPNGKDDLMNFEVMLRPEEGYYE